MKKNEGIKLFGEYAVFNYGKEKILPSLIIAQAILESGYFEKSELATRYNNYFGLKYYTKEEDKTYAEVTAPYGCVNYKTWEQAVDGKITDPTLAFCSFINPIQSVDCLYRWYNTPKYVKLKECTTYVTACYQVKACGYATDINYPAKLIKIIEENKLTEWDEKGLATVTELKRVQIGAFLELGNARKVVESLHTKGYTAIIKKIEIAGVLLYRVQVGAYYVTKNAENMKNCMIALGYKDSYITTEGGEDIS